MTKLFGIKVKKVGSRSVRKDAGRHILYLVNSQACVHVYVTECTCLRVIVVCMCMCLCACVRVCMRVLVRMCSSVCVCRRPCACVFVFATACTSITVSFVPLSRCVQCYQASRATDGNLHLFLHFQCNHRSWTDFFLDAYLTEGNAALMSRCNYKSFDFSFDFS
jgi:hypothetical protein